MNIKSKICIYIAVLVLFTSVTGCRNSKSSSEPSLSSSASSSASSSLSESLRDSGSLSQYGQTAPSATDTAAVKASSSTASKENGSAKKSPSGSTSSKAKSSTSSTESKAKASTGSTTGTGSKAGGSTAKKPSGDTSVKTSTGNQTPATPAVKPDPRYAAVPASNQVQTETVTDEISGIKQTVQIGGVGTGGGAGGYCTINTTSELGSAHFGPGKARLINASGKVIDEDVSACVSKQGKDGTFSFFLPVYQHSGSMWITPNTYTVELIAKDGTIVSKFHFSVWEQGLK